MSVFKIVFFLLVLLMEIMVDMIQKYFKCLFDDDVYCLIVVLFNDSLLYVSWLLQLYVREVKFFQVIEFNIIKFVEMIFLVYI